MAECGADAGKVTSTYGYVASGYGTNSTTPLVASIAQEGVAFSYAYDSRNNVVIESRNGTATTFIYDDLSQLVRVNDPHDTTAGETGTTWVFNYDRGGNITSKVRYAYTTGTLGTVQETIPYTYSDSNWKDKLTTYNDRTFTYDAIGNPTSDSIWSFEWEIGRRLKRMSAEGTALTFKYDHNGLRTSKIVEQDWYPVTTKYLWDGNLITHMTVDYTDWDEVAQQDVMHFFYDAQSRPAKVSFNGVIYTYIHNMQGDIVGLLDNAGNLVVEYKYDAWGRLLSTAGTMSDTLGKRNPFRYRGYVYDEESGLYYLQSRYYSPELTRFLSPDKDNILEDNDSPLATNLYIYCFNCPTSMIDEDGEAAVNIIGGVFGGLSGAALGTLIAKILGLRGFAKAAAIAICAGGGIAAGALLGPRVAKYAKSISGAIKAAAASFLRVASKAAMKAARNVGRFTVSAKHLATAGGRYAKFRTNSQSIIRTLIRIALRSPNAQFYANGDKANSFIVLYKFAFPIGTKGERYIKIIVDTAGKIWTAFPQK